MCLPRVLDGPRGSILPVPIMGIQCEEPVAKPRQLGDGHRPRRSVDRVRYPIDHLGAGGKAIDGASPLAADS